ncbi:hypothetical protein AVEN_169521-1 [Araneus ventricosus]|uniref:Uncharacterized protein n=1 Tax=Araneus ventricosus TaxID=182803 RepID=A0A4Y2U8Z7_ARAVE|nr:hypothetical protein AVEN_41009-1 [Araneus ventricosus]GBO09298.1 hypothetical protein AVEN_169521-1 [Araneus ventricosus]
MWVGRDGPIRWSLRSPDLASLDFFLWGVVQDQVYRTKVTDLQDLKTSILNAFEHVTIELPERKWRDCAIRVNVLACMNERKRTL